MDPPSATHMSVPASGANDMDRALDTVAALLGRYGELPFDVGERSASDIRAEFEEWAKRILNGGDGENAGAPRRDFGGARRFFDDHRKTEAQFVRSPSAPLRATIDTFARCVRTTVVDDRAADAAARGQLAALADALSANDIGRIK